MASMSAVSRVPGADLRLVILLPILPLGGCIGAPPLVSERTGNIIAVCSAGYQVTLSAGLEANIVKASQGDIDARAKFERAVKGQFLATQAVTEERAVELFRSYL